MLGDCAVEELEPTWVIRALKIVPLEWGAIDKQVHELPTALSYAAKGVMLRAIWNMSAFSYFGRAGRHY